MAITGGVIGIYRCLFDFTAQLKNDLSMHSGDIVKVTKQINSDWLAGIANNKEGQFPSSYVEKVLQSLPDKVGFVLSNFIAEQDGDLPIKKGDVVGIIEYVDANWVRGFSNYGKGIFPAKFIKEIDFSILDGSGKLDIGNTEDTRSAHNAKISLPHGKGEALDNFYAQDVEELTIKKGDSIDLIRELDNFWMEGVLKGKRGKFPKEFIKVIHDLPPSMKYSEPSQKESNETTIPHAKAIHMFIGENSNEISFDKGDVITLVSHFNKDWMKGKIGNSIGLFPLNHVKILVDLPFSLKGNDKIHSPGLPFTPLPPKVSNGSISCPDLGNTENQFPIPPTIYPKSHEATVSYNVKNKQTHPDVKRRNDKPKHGVEKKDIDIHKSVKATSLSPAVVIKENPVLLPNRNSDIQHVNKHTSDLQKMVSSNMEPLELGDERVALESASSNKPPLLPRCPTNVKPPILPRCPTSTKSRAKAPARPECQQSAMANNKYESDSDIFSPVAGGQTKLPKPLAPLPAQMTPPPREKNRSCEMTLDLKPKVPSKSELLSPVAMVDSKDMTVTFKNISGSSIPPITMCRNESFDSIDSISHLKTKGNQKVSVDERDIRKVSDNRKNPEHNFEGASKPLYSDATPKGYTMEESLNVSHTFSTTSGTSLPSSQDSLEGNGAENVRSIELRNIEMKIVEVKGKIEAAVYQLSGVETLLDFVGEDKVNDLLVERDKHNENITELNLELNGLEDQKSSLLASYGKVDDVKNRVAELEKQIDMYLDNCDKLRRMQDVSVVEDLPEIRDNIEFCESMIDTLQDELNGLREKLGEIDHPDCAPDPEKQVAKRKRNQRKVIDELVYTEERYIRDLTIASNVMKYLEESMSHSVNIKMLFGNLPVIIELAKKLLYELKKIINEAIPDDMPSLIATSFLDLCSEMKEYYSDYCRNYDDAQSLLEKYEEDPEVMFAISKVLKTLCHDAANLMNLQAYLIKPVQRVLKYPLLLSEILKNHNNEDLSKEVLKYALTQLTDVAAAINEFKRRKDLVQKYREIEDGIGKKVQKLNWHSVAKKSSRINQRITQFTGLNKQTIDCTFTEFEKCFRALDKQIKSFSKNVVQFLEEFQKNSSFVKQCSESIRQFFEDNEVCEEVIKYYSRIYVVTEQYSSKMVIFINRHVTDPLNQMLQLFQGPFRLIQKRNDKCLDYDRAQNKAMRARDSKDEDKIKQTLEELQNSENVYVALNTQLLEELPSLCNSSTSFLKCCVANFVEAYKQYLSSSYYQMYELWQLPFVSKEQGMLEIHQELISIACEHLSLLSFIPLSSTRDSGKKNLTVQTLPGNLHRTSFFVDLDDFNIDTTTPLKPLIDLNGNDFDEVDTFSKIKKSPKKLFGTSDWTYQEETSNYIVKYNFQAEDDVELSASEGTHVTVLRKSDKNGNSEWWYVDMDGQKGYIPQSYLVADTKTDIRYSRSKSSIMSNIFDRNIVRKLETSMTGDHHSDFPDPPPELIPIPPQELIPAPPPELIPNLMDEHVKLSIGDNSVNKFNTVNGTEGLLDFSPFEKQDTQPMSYGNVQYYFMEYNFEGENPGELSIREGEVVKVVTKHDQKGNAEWWHVDYNGEKGYVPGGFLVFLDEVPMC